MRSCPRCSTTCEDSHRFCHGCGGALGSAVVRSEREPDDPLIGSTLPGGYVIRELIAEGGMGRIYRAEQRALDRWVAVKVIHPHLAGDPAIAARFLLEARAASRLNHPNAVTVIAFGNMPGGEPYLVMQLLHGKQLDKVAAQQGPLAPSRIVDILCQTLGALEQAHALSIVHQDIKPDNILVERLRSGGDLVKVIDFGLAHIVAETEGAPAIAGTPAYMSPQRARGERVDGRSDLYSTGVVLYELLTGVLPFDAKTTTETLLAVLNKAPIDPRVRAPQRNVPDALAEAAMKALAKRPEDGFQTADAFAAALLELSPHSVQERYSRPPPDDGVTCGACGVKNQQRRAFCGECGASLAVVIPKHKQPIF